MAARQLPLLGFAAVRALPDAGGIGG